VENSYDLVKKLNGKHFNDNCILISLDVISLFTNISIDLVLTSTKNRWDYIIFQDIVTEKRISWNS